MFSSLLAILFIISSFFPPNSGTPSPCLSWRTSCAFCSVKKRNTSSRSCSDTPWPAPGCRRPWRAPLPADASPLRGTKRAPFWLDSHPPRTWPVRAASKDPGEPDPERLLSKRESETGRGTERERASANVRVKWCERWDVPYTRRVWCAWENERSRDWQRRPVISSNVCCYCWITLWTTAVSL